MRDLTSALSARIQKYSEMLSQLMDSKGIRFRDIVPSAVPYEPGSYQVIDVSKDPWRTLYAGESTNLSERLYSHLMANRRASTLKDKMIRRMGLRNEDAVKEYLRENCNAQYVVIHDDDERIGFEHFAIAALAPDLND